MTGTHVAVGAVGVRCVKNGEQCCSRCLVYGACDYTYIAVLNVCNVWGQTFVYGGKM